MGMELFKLSAGVDILGIPYKGDGLIASALMAGEVDVAVVSLPTTLHHIREGRMRVLGVTSAKRSAALPDVPTIMESGVDMEHVGWYGLFAPAKTPRAIVERIQQEAAKTLVVPDVRGRILGNVLEPVGSTPDDFETRYRMDLVKYARIVREGRIPLQN